MLFQQWLSGKQNKVCKNHENCHHVKLTNWAISAQVWNIHGQKQLGTPPMSMLSFHESALKLFAHINGGKNGRVPIYVDPGARTLISVSRDFNNV